MKKNKIKILIFIGIFTLIFNLAANVKIDFREEIKKISSVFIQEIENEHQIYCIGEGGHMANDLEGITLSFIAYREGSIEEARKIEVCAIQKLTQLINANKKLRPYLREYPFPTHRVEICLSYKEKDNNYYPNNLAYISHINGILRYRSQDLSTPKLILLHQETFEEALKIVTQTK